jgi:DNA polymerase-3 subunit alpha
MQALFADLPEALENSVEIARRCNLSVELGKNRLPQFPDARGRDLDDFLTQQAEAGLERRLAQLYPDAAEREQRRRSTPRASPSSARPSSRWASRLLPDRRRLHQLGQAERRAGGAGRGSGAGSLVAYSLGITDLDPLRYELLFERFLNPERVSMPDFDVDFCQEGRDRVIDYVKKKYGATPCRRSPPSAPWRPRR